VTAMQRRGKENIMEEKSVPAAAPADAPFSDPSVQSTPEDSTPEQDEIARLAYSYWEARGGGDGLAEDDWYRAESELKAARAAAGK
jgi:hypothetical protein